MSRKKYKKRIKEVRIVGDANKEIKDELEAGDYNKNIKSNCSICGKFINNTLENYLERGNCCEQCSGSCLNKVKDKKLSLKEKLKEEQGIARNKCDGDCINCDNIQCLSNFINNQKI